MKLFAHLRKNPRKVHCGFVRRALNLPRETRSFTVRRFGGSVVAAQCHDVVAPKGRFCATPGCAREFCVSHSCVTGLIDFRAIGRDGVAFSEPRVRCDSSAELDWRSGEQSSLAVKSQTLKIM